MNAVGIDVSKGKSTVAILRPFGELVSKPFNVPHTANSLKKLAQQIQSLDGETRVVMEHTGRYYEPIAMVLQKNGIFVSAVNPLLIKEYGGNSLRKTKTDAKDSLKIARYGLDNWVELGEHSTMDTIRYELKTLNRQHDLFINNKIALKNNLIAVLDQTYPGANTYFESPVREDGSQKWVDFVGQFWHVDMVRKSSLNIFTEKYRKFCKKHGYQFSSKKASEIHEIAKELVPLLPKSNLSKVLVKEAVAMVNATSKSAQKILEQMDALARELPEYETVMAMYGVGNTLGLQLMAELGDVRRFAHRGAITAFAGVDPGSNQSGTHESKSNRTSKRGSPHLRKALFLVMSCLLQKAPPDEAVYQFMDKKRAEGKAYYVYMTAGCNKFLRIYYARVKEAMAASDIPIDWDSTGLPN